MMALAVAVMGRLPCLRAIFPEDHGDAVNFLEHGALFLHGHALDRQVLDVADRDDELAGFAREGQVADLLHVVAVHRVRDPQDGGQLGHGNAAVAVQRRILHVRRARHGAPVIAGHERDQGHVVSRQPEQVAVQDQVHRVLVVAAAADEPAHLVEECGDLEQKLVALVELVYRLKLAEQLHAKVCHVPAVLFVDPVLFAERERGVDDLPGERAGPEPRERHLLQKAVAKTALRDDDAVGFEGAREMDVDKQGRTDGFRFLER